MPYTNKIFIIAEPNYECELICLVVGKDPEPDLVEYRARKKIYIEAYDKENKAFRDKHQPPPSKINTKKWSEFVQKLTLHLKKFTETNCDPEIENVKLFLTNRGYTVVEPQYRDI